MSEPVNLDAPPADEFEGLPDWCRPGAEVYYSATHGWSGEDLTLHKATVERILKRDVVFRVPAVRGGGEIRFTRRDYTPTSTFRSDADTFHKLGVSGRIVPLHHPELDLLQARAHDTNTRRDMAQAIQAWEKGKGGRTPTLVLVELLEELVRTTTRARNAKLALASAEARAAERVQEKKA